MMRKGNTTVVMAALLSGPLIWSTGETLAETGKAVVQSQPHSESPTTRIVYGTVDDVARNLVKVNQEITEGITPRYLDLSEVENRGAIQKGDQVKMKVNLHNMVLDYWIIEKN
jgi:hypothetical protein